MIPTYNCASYLREALCSVLEQDPGPGQMQIEVVDDFSTLDDPAEVVETFGQSRVDFFQQPENVGHCHNFNTCLQRSRGRLIHLLHGDDSLRDGFYLKMERAFAENPSIGAAFCRYISTDEYGNWINISPLEQVKSGVLSNWLYKIAAGQRIQPPSMVVRREVYEQLGGFDQRVVSYGEDWEMWVRIAARYPVWYEVEPLALYRIHTHSLTSKASRTGQNGRDLRRVIEINKSSLPNDMVTNLTIQAKRNFALACLRRASRMLTAHEFDAALAQIGEAVRTHRSWDILTKTFFLLVRYCLMKLAGLFPKQLMKSNFS
jgi:glycosyltransferase involved in cell wall biosynthesis